MNFGGAGALIQGILGAQFGWVKIVAGAGVLLIIGGTIFASYKYVTDLQKANIQLTANNAVLETNNTQLENSIEQQRETIDIINAHHARSAKIARETAKDLAVSRTHVDVLEQKLGEHNIGYLAAQKPGLVQNIFNNAADELNRCFEIASGSPLTDDEINATLPSQINSQCPDLANPNYKEKK